MSSAHWDEMLAERYRNFRYEFAEKTLAGRSVIVAGGTGGLGGALVALLAREGAHVVAGYRSNRERALQLQRAMADQFSASIEVVEGDILDASVRRAYLAAAEKSRGAFAGAAIFSFQSNYSGPILLAKELGEALEKAGGGNLVLLATMQAVAPFPGSLNYAAPKAALVHGARILAQQWNHVAVNVVAPGATVAGMAESSVRSGKYDRFVASGAIPRFGRPEDIAHAVRFFLEPGVYANGQVLVVDGGLTLRRDRG
jgi:NAD(P)-dependent dehydrogenase (short-subunit alcohol dehydrogenase family)